MTAKDWISVLDRLPEPGVDVLVFAEISGVATVRSARLFQVPGGEKVWLTIDGADLPVDSNVVTYWAPIEKDGETPS